MKFKCPVCQTILELGSETELRCHQCDSTFNQEKILAIHQRRSNSRKPESESDHDAPTIIRESSGNRLIQKKQSQVRLGVAIGFGLVAIVLALAVAVVVVNQNSKSTVSKNAMEPSDEVEVVTEVPAEPSSESTGEDQLPTVQPKRIPFELVDRPDSPIGKPSNQFKSKRMLEKTWFQVRPYLLELYAETPTGPQYATGVVVDSRGWIATSYHAIKGATEIHVRQSHASVERDSDRLSDKVRGYIAVQPEYDLVLLAVNRRLINTIEDLSFVPENRVVSSQYLIQCQPPTHWFPYATMESRVNEAGIVESLSESIADRIRWRKLDPKIRWIIHQNVTPLKFGAPLLDDQGNVVAINTATFNHSESSTVALPSSYVLELKRNAFDDILPLPVGPSDNFGDLVEAMESSMVLPLDSESRTLSERLNSLGEQCDAFQWWPETVAQEAVFREFLRALVEAKNEANVDANDNAETLLSQANQWERKLADTLGVNGALSDDKQRAFNQRFVGARVPGEPFIGFAFISHSAINLQKIAIAGREPREAVGLAFKGMSARLMANIEPNWPPMPVDSPWLVIGTGIHGGRVRLIAPDGNKLNFEMGNLHFVHQAD